MPKRMDSADTVDTATHFLHWLQSEGLVLSSMDYDLDYGTPAPKDPKAPRMVIGATLIVRLVPVRRR